MTFICPLFYILFDLYPTFIYFWPLFYFHLDPRETGWPGTQQQNRSTRRYLLHQDKRGHPAQDVWEVGDVDLDWNVTELGSSVTATSYSESISTIAPPPNRVISGRLNWNMCTLYTPIYTPPTLYPSGLHVTGFCKLCPLPPPLKLRRHMFQFIFPFRCYSHSSVTPHPLLISDNKMPGPNCFGWSRVVTLTLAPYTIFALAHSIMMYRLPPLTHSIQLACYFLDRPSSKPPLGSKMLICMSVIEVLCLLSEFYCPPPPPPVPYNIYIDPLFICS